MNEDVKQQTGKNVHEKPGYGCEREILIKKHNIFL